MLCVSTLPSWGGLLQPGSCSPEVLQSLASAAGQHMLHFLGSADGHEPCCVARCGEVVLLENSFFLQNASTKMLFSQLLVQDDFCSNNTGFGAAEVFLLLFCHFHILLRKCRTGLWQMNQNHLVQHLQFPVHLCFFSVNQKSEQYKTTNCSKLFT